MGDFKMMPISSFRHLQECPVMRGPDCISKCICQDETVRKWRMEIRGFPPFAIISTSRSKARMAAFQQAREAGYYTDFKVFLADVRSFRRMDWSAEP